MPRRASIFRLEPFADHEDPHRTPAASCNGDPAPAWTLRRAQQNRLAMYLFGLVFMIFPAITVWQRTTGSGGRAFGLAAIAVLTGLYAGAAFVSDTGLRTRYLYLGAFAAVMASTAFVIGLDFSGFGVYFAILLAALIPWRVSRVLVVVWGVWLLVLGLITQIWTPLFIGLIAIGLGWAIGSGIEQSRVAEKLRRVELRAGELAVVAERERIARDLHDILGHSLTAVSIKAGLAGRLVGADDDGARTQIAEVEAIARQALADVRATASAMREVRLATEIASARSVLEAAGISAETPTALEPVPGPVSELFGYVVREAVTNVVRHSRAGRCVITVGPGVVTVADDGQGLPAGPGATGADGSRADGSGAGGSGLTGLRHRLEAGGGSLVLEPGPDGRGLTVRAAVPEPRSAAPRAGRAGQLGEAGPGAPSAGQPVSLPAHR